MNSIIKNGGFFATEDEINAHAEKLTFNTREEYIEWVKQWKEDYNNVVLHHRIDRLFRRSHQLKPHGDRYQWFPLTSQKAQYRQAKIKQLETQVTMKENEIVDKLSAQIKNEYNYVRPYGRFECYNLIHYLLAVRKASKVRAARLREERLKAEGKL